MKLTQMIALFGGELRGDDVDISQVAPLETAKQGEISFLANRKYTSKIAATAASALILPPDLSEAFSGPRILASNPYLYFAKVSGWLNPERSPKPGIHPTAWVDPSAVISPLAEIGPFAMIGANAIIGERVLIGSHCSIGDGVTIGKECRLKSHVTLYEECHLGERVIVHAGAVIGSDGFGIANDQGKWVKIPQIGRVLIGNDVEIGANTTIDRGAMSDTVIEEGVKLDNQIQVAHNVVIGAHTAIAGCVGIAGSAKIGRNCTIGGGAIVLGHLTVADKVNVSAGTLVTKSIKNAGTYTGVFPFEEHDAAIRNAVQVKHLSRLADKVAALEKLFKQDN